MPSVKLYASNAPRWGRCPGSAQLEPLCPESNRFAADKGVDTHQIGYMMLLLLIGGSPVKPEIFPDCPREEFNKARIYAEYVFGFCVEAQVFNEPYLLLEKKFEVNGITGVRPPKPDAILWDIQNLTLHVFDFKSGFVPVYSDENYQLNVYALAALEFFGIRLNDERVKIQTHIVQPGSYMRLEPTDSTVLSMPEFMDELQIISKASTSAHSNNPLFKPGDHCLYCRGKGRCKVVGNVLAHLIDYTYSFINDCPTAQSLSYEAEILILAKDLLELRLNGVTSEIEAKLQKGERVPKFSTERKPGNAYWSIPEKDVERIFKSADINCHKVMTPYQMLQNGANKQIVGSLCERRPGKTILKKLKQSEIAKKFERK